MLKIITNMQISHRLLLAFLFTALIPGIAISILGVTCIKQQEEQAQTVQININALKFATATGADLASIRPLLDDAYKTQYGSTLTKHTTHTQSHIQPTIDQLRIHTIHIDTAIQQYSRDYAVATAPQMAKTLIQLRHRGLDDPDIQALPAQQQASLDQVTTNLWPTYKSLQEQFITDIVRKEPATHMNQLLTSMDAVYTSLAQQWNEVSDTSTTIGYTVAGSSSEQLNPILFLTLLTLVSTILAVAAIGVVVYRTIMIPLQQLAQLTTSISQGDTNARAIISGNDEIFQAASSINKMLDYIIYSIHKTQKQRDELQGQIEKLVGEVSGIAEGDLRIQAEATPDALGILADSFNYMLEEFGSLIVRVKTVASKVESTTTIVVDRMTHLLETNKQQLTHVDDITAKIDQMSDTNRQVAECTQGLNDVTRLARLDAQLGRESLEQTVKGMGRINENVQLTASKVQILDDHSRAIDEIAEVIAGIAHQTNRLALDAAIQAAMAGENGKGFGAVAADIRRLAERVKDQTSLITRIIRSVREEVGAVAFSMQDTEREAITSTRLSLDAGGALDSLFAAVEHQAHEAEEINQMAMHQLRSSKSVLRTMQEITEANRRSSASIQETSKYMERQRRLLEQLRSSVEAFRLRENQRYQVPISQIMLDLNNEQERPLTVSGVFRSVTASLPPMSRLTTRRLTSSPTAPPPSTEHDFSHTPMPGKTIKLSEDAGQELQSISPSPEKPTSKHTSA